MTNSDPSNNAVSQNHNIEVLSEEVYPKVGYNKCKHWSDDENNVLKSLLESKKWKDINWKEIRDEEKLFGRELKAIQDKTRIFFKKERKEKEFMVHQNHKIEVLSDEVNRKIGYNKCKHWSVDENNVLKSLLDAKSWKDIRDEEKLFGRDLKAIQDKARKFFKKERQELMESQVKRKGKKGKKVEGNCELPCDVFDVISKTLDFYDLFQFAGVCKSWRAFHKVYWRNLLASQEPLLLQLSYHRKESYSFISIPDQKIYCLKMMEYFFHSMYVTSSSGYFIMAGYNNSFLLINPFTRIKKVINISAFEVKSYVHANHALLAFGKCSNDFVLVVLCKSSWSLRVYQSRNCGWVTYSTTGNQGRIVDFMVLHKIIYVVTDKANIGVLSLNFADIKFLKLKSIPNIRTSKYLKLVNCDEQLLVVDLWFAEIRNVYKIDFSTMNYVKLKTLGNIALFYALNTNCYALSNPNRWGYESNSVYFIDPLSTQCNVYSGDDKKLQKCITLPAPCGSNSLTFTFDWCFRHPQYEVDYSLVE